MSKFTQAQLLDLAERLGLDRREATVADLLRAAGKLGERREQREYADPLDAPTLNGILKLAPEPAPRAARGGANAPGDADIDAAIAAGRIGSDERQAWQKRYARPPPPRGRGRGSAP